MGPHTKLGTVAAMSLLMNDVELSPLEDIAPIEDGISQQQSLIDAIEMSFELDRAQMRYNDADPMEDFIDFASDTFSVVVPLQTIPVRRHKKRRIQKKWNKRYGVKTLCKQLDGVKATSYDEDGIVTMIWQSDGKISDVIEVTK